MPQIKSRYGVVRVLDCSAASSDAHAANESVSLCEGEQEGASLPPVKTAEGAVPGWDNLWVDLGGEG